jgi:hypothetical protein
VELNGLISLVERIHNTAASLSVSSVLAVNNPDPRILPSVSIDDAPRVVRGAIIYDDPFFGANCLTDHAVDGKSDISFFVANGTYDNIVCGQLTHIDIV